MTFEYNEELLDLLLKKTLGSSYTSSNLVPGQEHSVLSNIFNKQIFTSPITDYNKNNFTWGTPSNVAGGGTISDLTNVDGETYPTTFTYIKKYENIPMSVVPGTNSRAWKPTNDDMKEKFKNTIIGKSNFSFIIETNITNYETLLSTHSGFKPIINSGVLVFIGNISPNDNSTIIFKELYIYEGDFGLGSSMKLSGLEEINLYDEIKNPSGPQPQDKDALVYDAENDEWVPGATALTLNELTDVTIDVNNLADGEVLTYDATSNNFIPKDVKYYTSISINNLEDVNYETVTNLDSGDWIFEASFSPIDDLSNGDNFGEIISATDSLSYLAIGAPNKDNSVDELNTGGVYIFNSDRKQHQLFIPPLLPPPQKHEGDIRFGSSLDIKDNFLIIGAPLDNYVDETNTVIVDGGIVYSYKFSSAANKYGGFSEPDFVFDISLYAGTGVNGDSDDLLDQSLLSFPKGLTIDSNENIYVADYGNNKIKILSDNQATTFSTTSILNRPYGIIFDPLEVNNYSSVDIISTKISDGYSNPSDIIKIGNDIYVTDTDNDKIVKIEQTSYNKTDFLTGLNKPKSIVYNPTIQETHNNYDYISTTEISNVTNPKYIKIINDDTLILSKEDNFLISLDSNDDKTDLIGTTNLIVDVSELTWTQLGDDIDGEAAGDGSGSGLSLNGNGTILAIGAPKNTGVNGADSGHVKVYQYASDSWSQLGDDIDGEAAGDESGYSVSLSSDGTILAIGAPNSDENGTDSGHVKIYQYSGGSWSQKGYDIGGDFRSSNSDESGHSISLSSDGTVVAIGAPKNAGDKGHVRIYRWREFLASDIDENGDILDFNYVNQRDSGFYEDLPIIITSSDGTVPVVGTYYWTQMGIDIDGDVAGDQYGFHVSLNDDGTIVAIGSKTTGVKIYEYSSDDDDWTQLGSNLFIEHGQHTCSLNGDGTICIVGNPNYGGGDVGLVKVYQYASGSWTQLGQDLYGNAEWDLFGGGVDISSDGTIIAVGAWFGNSPGADSGYVKIYKYANNTWTQIDTDIPGEAASDHSGLSVSLNNSGTTLAISGHGNDGNGTDAGHVRVYTTSDPSLSSTTNSHNNYSLNAPESFDTNITSLTLSQIESTISTSIDYTGTVVDIEKVGNDIYLLYNDKVVKNTSDYITGLNNAKSIIYDSNALSIYSKTTVNVTTKKNNLNQIGKILYDGTFYYSLDIGNNQLLKSGNNDTSTWTALIENLDTATTFCFNNGTIEYIYIFNSLSKKIEKYGLNGTYIEDYTTLTYNITDMLFDQNNILIISKENDNIFKLFPSLPSNTTCLTTSTQVNVISSGGNKYVFNGENSYDSSNKYGLYINIYNFTDIPQEHPIAILNNGNSNIIYTGDTDKKFTKAVTGTTNDGTYDFYYGDVAVNVSGDFGTVSVYCYYHGYMGGENLLKYVTSCEVDGTGSDVIALTTDVVNPTQIKLDPNSEEGGDIIICEKNQNKISRIPYDENIYGNKIVILQGLNEPTSFDIDSDNNLFVINKGDGTIRKAIPPQDNSNTYTLDSIHSGTENNISSSDNVSYRRYYYDEIDNSLYNNNFTWEFTNNSYILLENSNKYLISEKNCIKEYSDTTITNYQTGLFYINENGNTINRYVEYTDSDNNYNDSIDKSTFVSADSNILTNAGKMKLSNTNEFIILDNNHLKKIKENINSYQFNS